MIDEKIMQEVNKMSYDDLNKLNMIVRTRLREMAISKNITLANKFSIGDTVKWLHKNMVHHGKIIRCNLKTATVEENNNRFDKWSISWQCLQKED